jgi:molybdopterin-guanine dinucleotide biosynthesis protein A
MLLNVVDVALQISQDIVVATKPERINKYKKIIDKQIKIISDDPPIKDSMLLAGVNAGIQHLQNEYILIIAGDMPFIRPEVIKILIDNAHQNDVTAPIHPDGITEPLLAIYKHGHIQKSIKTILKKEQIRATDLIRSAYKIRFIPTDEIRKVDPELRSLISINKPKEMQKQILRQMLNNAKVYSITFKDLHPYWEALNAYLNRFYQHAALLFTEEAKVYRKYGITHLELHALNDALNVYKKLNYENFI